MYCSKCGSKQEDTTKFCSNCGNKIQQNFDTNQNANTYQNTQAPTNHSPQYGQNQAQPINRPQPINQPPQYGQNQAQPINRPQPINQPPQYGQNQAQPTYRPQPLNQSPQYGQNPMQEMNRQQHLNQPMQYGQQMPPNNNAPQKKKSSCCLKFFLGGLIIFVLLIVLILLIPEDDEYYNDNEGGSFSQESTNGYDDANEGAFGTDLQIDGLRDFHTTLKGDGTDTSTVMIYFIGSDLETDGGFASGDIEEIAASDFGDNVNVVLMTGGAYYWYHDEISSDTCQYWQVKDGELIEINNDLGQLNMAAPQTLTNFINDTAAAFPADRYNLILWNHGGGTLSGFGYDEYYPDSTLTLASLDDAFSASNVKFDFVGFDACLMATAETALMLEPHADYLIASQELEPGTGWYYTDWLSYLSENPSTSTEELGVNIIDDFVEVCEQEIRDPNATLSIVELRQMPYLYSVLTDYFENSTEDIMNNEYRKISVARSDAKDFGEGDCDQIDMVDYVEKADVDGGDLVIEAVNSAVRYYNNSSDVRDSNGLAMYFPLEYLSYYSDMQSILHYVGYTPEYTEFFNVFISAMSGGQTQYHRDTGTEITEDYSTQEWYDADTALIYEESTEGEFLGELVIDEKGDEFVLSLAPEEWDEINKIELQVLIDDGEGYIDLGSDNVYEFDEDGDLIVGFDYTWVTLDGHTVPYYVESEDYISDDVWSTHGFVPAYLNDEYVEIIVNWDNTEPLGYVSGYRKYSEIGEPVGKGVFPLEAGDTIEWVIDYYTYDWEYEDYYLFGDPLVLTDDNISVSYDYIGDVDAVVYFKLTDIYNNIYETEAVAYTD